jgi:hypothetical protein
LERDGMSFTDGKPWLATAEDCAKDWCCAPNGKDFRCGLCGYKFMVGDTVRWMFTNNIPGAGGNPFVCLTCDGPLVIEVWKAKCASWKSDEWWWFRKRIAP